MAGIEGWAGMQFFPVEKAHNRRERHLIVPSSSPQVDCPDPSFESPRHRFDSGGWARGQDEDVMPARIKAPGAYVVETSTDVRPIAGVATSIAAFIGRAARGSVDAEGPVAVDSQADFEHRFGMLDPANPMGQAVRDFFTNGGRQAVIVRLYQTVDGKPAKARINIPGLPLEAASPGSWGNALRARIDAHVAADAAKGRGLDVADLFNLTLHDAGSGATETFRDVTVRDGPRRVDRVLAADSLMARVAASPAFPGATVPPAHQDPPAGGTPWNDDAFSTGVSAADQAADSGMLDDATYLGDPDAGTGLHALARADLFNLLCVPPDTRDGDTSAAVYHAAAELCVARRALLIVDAPAAWTDVSGIIANWNAVLTALNLDDSSASHAALYFPRIVQPDPASQGGSGTFVACGAIAGIMARMDSQRGVWKAPAGTEATLVGVQGLAINPTSAEGGDLNQLGINCLRNFPAMGFVVWGARTLQGASGQGGDYRYVPVRRLAMFIEESLARGLQWAVFEVNDSRLWAQIRTSVGAFLHGLFMQGAFQGSSPRDAYFARCDAATTTQDDIDNGVANIEIGFAPVRPAEFVILRLQQRAGCAPP